MKTQQKIILTVIILVAASLIADNCLARAGGGGGGFGGRLGNGEGSGFFTTLLAFILAPFFLIYSAIVTVMLERKRNKIKKLTEEISKKDKLWNFRTMMARVEEVFFKVQKAWTERNQDLAKDCMSERIYEKHKLQTDELISKGTRNVLERINLEEAMIYSLSDYKDNSLDSFSVRIKGSMVDYMIDENTKNIISGDNSKAESFKEIWTFIRIGNKWVLDEIDQNVTMGDIRQGQAYSEK